jgi:transcriptional regulator with XRE-family HTH domain
MATHKASSKIRAAKLNQSTNVFLESLNGGPLTFGQLLTALREADDLSLARFSERLGVSRQHLHQIETGQKRVSPERALRFAKILGFNELYFVQLALQDLVDETGLTAKVEIRVA